MGCVQSKKNENLNIYRVINVDANGEEIWHGHLEISPKELILHRKGKEPTKWSLQHLRRYGFESEVFTFEAGRRCPTGEGIFAFKCRHAENLFHIMQNYIQGIAMSDDINQQLSDMNLSGINANLNGPTNSLVVNRLNRQSIPNSRSNNLIQSHNSFNYLNPLNRQGLQSPNGSTNFSNSIRGNDTFSNDGNYLEPTPMRNNLGNTVRYSSGLRLSSVGSGPISPEPNSPGSPNSFNTILEVTSLNQVQPQQQQNYANSNIYHEFPCKSSESNNNLLNNNKNSPDVPPQEPAPIIQMSTININHNSIITVEDNGQNREISYSPTVNENDSRMYVNVIPGELENIRNSNINTPSIITTNQSNFVFQRLSSTHSIDLSNRCYENLEPGEFRTMQLPSPLQSKYSKPDIFSKVDLPCLGGIRTDNNTECDKLSEPTTPTSKELKKVNYIVLDLDSLPSSASVVVNPSNTPVSNNTTNIGNTTNNNSILNTSNTLSSSIIGSNIMSLENSKNSSLGYATIDFNKTVALSNSTMPSVELDNEGSRKTRHSSTAIRQSNSMSD